MRLDILTSDWHRLLKPVLPHAGTDKQLPHLRRVRLELGGRAPQRLLDDLARTAEAHAAAATAYKAAALAEPPLHIWMDSPFGAIRTVLSQVYKFEPGEKEQARAVCAHIAGRDLASTKDMTRNEARAVLDTLSHWREQAGGNGEHPRDYLVAMMAAQDAARDA